MTVAERVEQAARWIALRQSGAMTPELERKYRVWLSDAENGAELAAHQSALQPVDVMSEELLAEEFERQLHEAYDAGRTEEENRRESGDRTRWRAIAASFTVVIVAGGALYLSKPFVGQPVTYASEVGQQITIALKDGSSATLNTNSALAVKFSDDKRGVRVAQGEALFDVATDPARPFVVQTAIATIEVTGTVFNVRSLPHQTSVSVLEGRVRVSTIPGSETELTAGQKLEIDASGDVRALAFDPQRELAWRGGSARYEEEPLRDVLADLNRYFVTPIVLADSSMNGVPVTGEFDVKDQNAAVASLVAAFELRATVEGGRILLTHDAP